MYSTDLAYIHDAGFGDLAERAAPELIRLLRAGGLRSGRVVDVGCGSGILARHLVDAGYDVIGIDRSPAMIRLARARVPEGRFRVASLLSARVPPCVAVTAIGEVVSYVSANLRPFFRRVHAALEPGGLFIFDFMESAERRTYRTKSFDGPDWALVSHADVDAAGRTLTRRMTMFRKVGKEYRRSQEAHRVRIRNRQEIAGALKDAGFSVRVGRSYGRYRLLPGDVAVIAQKK